MFQHKQTAGLKNSSSSLKTAQKLTFLLAVLIYLPLNAQLDFGDNKWNVNVYNNLPSPANTTPTGFAGSYTQKLDTTQNYGFATTLSWGKDAIPTSVIAMNNANGVVTRYLATTALTSSNRKFSYVHKRRGFPQGNYRIVMKEWDDNTYLFIDGVYKAFVGEDGWSATQRLISNCFVLGPTSTIEVITGNHGTGPTQAILEIKRTDVFATVDLTPMNICLHDSVQLNGNISTGATKFNQDLSLLSFETGFNSYTTSGPSDWNIGLASPTAGSGSQFIYTTIPTAGAIKWFEMPSFSTANITEAKITFRQYYRNQAGVRAEIQLSVDGSTWTNAKTLSGGGTATVYSPVELTIPPAFQNQANVKLRFFYQNTSASTVSNTYLAIDDLLVTGNGAAAVTYLWSPTTGLTNPTSINTTLTNVTSSQVYTLTATAGNCTVTNPVQINMLQIPAQPTITSSPAWFEYAVVNVPNVTYAWTTSPATGVGSFPYGNTTSTVTFIPSGAGNLIVTASNQCGTGTELVFNNPLPVTLTNFSANCSNGLTINWSTASEQNSDYYLVEKSRDMQNWTTVNKQNAAGNSNTSINYSAVDATAWNGLAYYRLRQFDFNGDEKIYDPISISCEGTENAMTVYPNPSKGEFTVEVTSNENALTQLEVIDLTGKIISSQDLSLTAGVNQVYFKSFDLTSGVYIVRVIGGNAAIQPVRVVIE